MFCLLCICLYENACYASVCCCDLSEFYSGVHRVAMTPCKGQQCALYMPQQWQTHNTHKAHCVGHSTLALHEQQAQPFQSESKCFHVCISQSLSVCAYLVSGITTMHLSCFWESLLCLFTSVPVQFVNHCPATIQLWATVIT